MKQLKPMKLSNGQETWMRAEEFKAARLELGLTLRQWGINLGYNDTKNMRNHIQHIETGLKPVRKVHVLLIQCYLKGCRPDTYLDNKGLPVD